jgi:hypothetical protein
LEVFQADRVREVFLSLSTDYAAKMKQVLTESTVLNGVSGIIGLICEYCGLKKLKLKKTNSSFPEHCFKTFFFWANPGGLNIAELSEDLDIAHMNVCFCFLMDLAPFFIKKCT